MTLLLNGFELAQQCRAELAGKIKKLDFQPKLVVIQIGDNPASTIYVRNKEKAAKEIGINAEVIRHKECSQKKLLSLIKELNEDRGIDGILVQLPLPYRCLPFHPLHLLLHPLLHPSRPHVPPVQQRLYDKKEVQKNKNRHKQEAL